MLLTAYFDPKKVHLEANFDSFLAFMLIDFLTALLLVQTLQHAETQIFLKKITHVIMKNTPEK